MQRLDLDDIQASAARFLIDGGALDAARILLACELGTEFGPDVDPGQRFVVVLAGPRAAYDELLRTEISGPVVLDEPIDEYAPTYDAVRAAIEAVIPPPYEVLDLAIRAQLQPASEGWRDEMIRALDTRDLSNQGPPEHTALTWETLRFRSASEIRIAAALDRAGVLFFPLPRGRVTQGKTRKTREPDFLICHDGRWGILEVGGEPYHPPSRTVQDHARDRIFRTHGIRVVEHFDAGRCFEAADGVVAEFLSLLSKGA